MRLSDIFGLLAQQTAARGDNVVEVPTGENAIQVVLHIGGALAAELSIGLMAAPPKSSIYQPNDVLGVDLLEKQQRPNNVIALDSFRGDPKGLIDVG